MSWQFTKVTKWYAAHRVPRDKWDRIMLIVVVAALILILGRYPLYIALPGLEVMKWGGLIAGVGSAMAVAGWAGNQLGMCK